MIPALPLRRTFSWLAAMLIAVLLLGAGHAAAAQRASHAAPAHASHHVLAYADGALTVARGRQHSHRRRLVSRSDMAPAAIASHAQPVAYADGDLVLARHHHRRILAHIV